MSHAINLTVKARIWGGFATTIAFLVIIAEMAYLGLIRIGGNVDEFGRVSGNTTRIMGIDRDVVGRGRNDGRSIPADESNDVSAGIISKPRDGQSLLAPPVVASAVRVRPAMATGTASDRRTQSPLPPAVLARDMRGALGVRRIPCDPAASWK